jgi:PTH1 family peptidyl-tRNA hydrolase
MLIDWLANKFHTQVKREECRSLIGRAIIENQTVELVKPQTFMNLSGEAIICLLKKENRMTERLIVVSDDLALPLGTIRLRPKGSAGGHNGLKSIIACLRTEEFIRLRIGIQPEHPLREQKDFVLENFPKTDLELVEKVLQQSTEAVCAVLADGVERTMAEFN